MDVNLRLGKGRAHEASKNGLERFALRRIELELEVPREIPLGKKLELAPKKRLVVRRQHVRLARELPFHKRVDRVREKRIGILLIERFEIGRGAEIGEEQVSAAEILRDHF